MLMLSFFIASLSIFGGAQAASDNATLPNNATLPTIDLGYVHQRATTFNSTTGLYTFSNIRYARPPLGDLRFRKPLPPIKEKNIPTSDGSEYKTTICSQPKVVSNLPLTPSSKGYTEDCLFLDVYVPQNIINNRTTSKVPVLLWIYGGGLTIGSKEDIYMVPNGLIRAANNGVIFVAINYRLGFFGWSSPPSEASVIPNLGLYDATLALQWVKNYIYLFGGNGNDVTVFGESAGGGLIMHLITAYGGAKGGGLFNKAIPQSPGYFPLRNNVQRRENQFTAFMAAANCTTVACLRDAPTEVIQTANANISLTPTGAVYAVVDGDIAPDLPSKLLLDGRFHKDVVVVAANNEQEGHFHFPSPENVTQETFDETFDSLLLNITEPSKTKIRNLFLDPSLNESIYERSINLVSEVLFDCNAQALGQSFGAFNKGFRYVFAIPPAQHGDDIFYTFYSQGQSPADSLVTNTTVASALQSIITSLALGSVPPHWAPNHKLESYGSRKGRVLSISNTTIQTIDDEWKTERCRILAEGLYKQG